MLPALAPEPPTARVWTPEMEGATATTLVLVPWGRQSCSSIGGCVSDFALAPLRGLDVQTSPERAKREGPARGRRQREAPQLKGAGRAPPLGRARGRKEGAGPPGLARGCERPQGGQPKGWGCVSALPAMGSRSRAGAAPGAGLRAGSPRQRQADDPELRWRAASASSPPPRGRRSRKRKRARAADFAPRAGGGPGGGGLRGLGGRGGAVSAPHPARGPRTLPELPGASLKAAPARLFSPFFVIL